MKQWSEIIRNVTMLSQLGLSLITPVLICLAVCWLIVSKTGTGGWVYIPEKFLNIRAQVKQIRVLAREYHSDEIVNISNEILEEL